MCEGSETMHFARDELERKYTIRDSVSSFGKRHMGERRRGLGIGDCGSGSTIINPVYIYGHTRIAPRVCRNRVIMIT